MPFANDQSIVVVPWDFSEYSRHALRRALDLVASPQQIRIVHVAQLPIMVGPGMDPESINVDSVMANSEQKFRDHANGDLSGKELQYVTLVNEEQGRAICDYAEDEKADLIVISTHGRTGFVRLRLGSVAERVVRYAPCDVLVVRHNVDH